MRVVPNQEKKGSIEIQLDETEARHLLSILLHAKFCDDVRLEIIGSPTMQTLLRGLIEARETLGFDRKDAPDWRTIDETSGVPAPQSFSEIERGLRHLLQKEDVTGELEENLYPFKWIRTSREG